MINQLRSYEDAASLDPFRSPDWRYMCAEAHVVSNDNMGGRTLSSVSRISRRKFVRSIEQDNKTEALSIFLACSASLTGGDLDPGDSLGTESDAELTALDYAQTSLRNAELSLNFGSLASAYRMYSERDKSVMRAEVEARVLARQNFPSIATSLGVDVSLIQAYCDNFFDVIPRLDNPSYIHRVVLRFTPGLGLDKSYTFEDQLRYWGYHAGGDFLDCLLSQTLYDPRSDGRSPEDKLDELFLTVLRTKTLASLVCMETNKYNITELVTLHAEMYHRRMESQKNQGAKGSYDKLISGILEISEWKMGTEARKAAEKTAAGKYIDTPAELRTEELFRLQAPDATIDVDLVDITFPVRQKDEQT